MSNYTLNFVPISVVGNTKIAMGTQPYSEDRLRELRREFHTTHVFHRDGRTDSIRDIPVTGASPIGNVTEEIDLALAHWIWPTLLDAALLRHFAGLRDIISTRPLSVLGSRAQLLDHPRLPLWMEKRPQLQFDTRTIYLGNGTRILGLVCETSVRNLIGCTVAHLLDLGFPIVGRYVQVESPHADRRVLPRRRLVGRVVELRGRELVLADAAEGYDAVAASEAYLEARRETLDDCVRHVLGDAGEGVIERAERAASVLRSGPGRKEQIEGTIKYLREKTSLEAVPGAKFEFGQLVGSDSRDFPATEIMPPPALVFDPSGSHKDNWSERGLKRSGPYDQRNFSPKKLRIAVICQAKHEGQVDRFVAKFLNGMPEVISAGSRFPRYGDGLIRRFHLEKPYVAFFTAPSASAADYRAASHQALGMAANEGFKWDLALVQVEEEFKSLGSDDNPYYATKSVLLKRDVAVQSVRLETMDQPEQSLVFSMNHMSLATYAKLGGTPWLLAAQQTVAHELVIGLGSHTVAGSRIGAGKRFVGITTVFSSDGSYLLSDRTAVVPFERYADALYETLKRSITTVRKQDNWRSTDKVRLVFHMFKPPKDTEADAIKRTVDDLGLENVTFAFVHIAPSNPFVVFDNTQKGIGYRDPKKGVLGPPRGLHFKLGDYESLVVFSGASELKQASDGIPRPCLLKLHRHSTFKDMTYLARQAFEFSGHSWRMLAPEPFPITIRYSDLIAERLAGLESVPGWDGEAVRFGQIGRTLWFL